jgi:TM2 domain-containing membrane protein YozV
MRGQILGVDPRSGDGLVAGDDGRRYTFRPEDWAHRGQPAVGLQVDFDTQETRALSIFPLPGQTLAVQAAQGAAPRAAANDRNKLVAALLAFFIGVLGVHRFYLGRTGSGILMLVMSITVVGMLVTLPWSIIDMIRYLVMSDEEFAARYARR